MKEKLLLKRNIKGFTLIELMITIAIIAILVTIAYPSYQGQLAKSRRSEAMVLLIEIMNRQDVFKSNYSTYTTIIKNPGGCSGSACGLKLNSVDGDKSNDSGYYIVTAAAGPTGSIVSSVTLTATRVGGKAQSADPCGNFTLTSTGVKGLTSNTYNYSQCWNR